MRSPPLVSILLYPRWIARLATIFWWIKGVHNVAAAKGVVKERFCHQLQDYSTYKDNFFRRTENVCEPFPKKLASARSALSTSVSEIGRKLQNELSANASRCHLQTKFKDSSQTHRTAFSERVQGLENIYGEQIHQVGKPAKEKSNAWPYSTELIDVPWDDALVA